MNPRTRGWPPQRRTGEDRVGCRDKRAPSLRAPSSSPGSDP